MIGEDERLSGPGRLFLALHHQQIAPSLTQMYHYGCSACPFARRASNGAQSRCCWDVLQPSIKRTCPDMVPEMQWWYTVECKKWVCSKVAPMTCNIKLSLLKLYFHPLYFFPFFLSPLFPSSALSSLSWLEHNSMSLPAEFVSSRLPSLCILLERCNS